MPEEPTRPFLVQRTYEIDFAGVVSNLVFIRWLENLRLTVLGTYYPLERFLDRGSTPTLVETRICYHRDVDITDRPISTMWIPWMRRMKFGFAADALRQMAAAVDALIERLRASEDGAGL